MQELASFTNTLACTINTLPDLHHHNLRKLNVGY